MQNNSTYIVCGDIHTYTQKYKNTHGNAKHQPSTVFTFLCFEFYTMYITTKLNEKGF